MNYLFSDFTRCYELCENIRDNRRLGHRHEALDSLQDGIKSTVKAISIEYTSLQKVFGSPMDFGDAVSRQQIKEIIREIELDIQNRLSDIANRRTSGAPGFRDMLRHITRLEYSISDALAALARRLEKLAEEKPDKKSEKKPEKKPEPPKPAPKKQDEIVIQLKDLERYTDHMKNSWEEKWVAGEVLYVNCFDTSQEQWERPEGFIKSLPKSTKPTTKVPTWEQYARRRRAPSSSGTWDSRDGW